MPDNEPEQMKRPGCARGRHASRLSMVITGNAQSTAHDCGNGACRLADA
ncbi:MAG: hypothetical protein LJE73_10455 [Proteobacteria bacterium]|nr:hypothetical protein [Pseudomonadota bacterium]